MRMGETTPLSPFLLPFFATPVLGANESLGPVTKPIPNGIVFAVDNGPEKEERGMGCGVDVFTRL